MNVGRDGMVKHKKHHYGDRVIGRRVGSSSDGKHGVLVDMYVTLNRNIGGHIYRNPAYVVDCDDGKTRVYQHVQKETALVTPINITPEIQLKGLLYREIVLAKPLRSIKKALKYIVPKRLTLKGNPRIHAWLWWNF
jgi:hypothetical protein